MDDAFILSPRAFCPSVLSGIHRDCSGKALKLRLLADEPLRNLVFYHQVAV